MSTTQSAPYLFSRGIVTALRGAFEPDGVVVRDNPTSAAALSEGPRVIFVEDFEDGPRDQPNQAERRTFSVNIGVINRTADDRANCDADMQACKALLVRHIPAVGRQLKESGVIETFAAPREGKRVYRIEGIDVGGALIVTKFDIDYSVPNTIARGRT